MRFKMRLALSSAILLPLRIHQIMRRNDNLGAQFERPSQNLLLPRLGLLEITGSQPSAAIRLKFSAAGRIQLRLIALQTGLDRPDIRDVGKTKSEGVAHAGRFLLRSDLSDGWRARHGESDKHQSRRMRSDEIHPHVSFQPFLRFLFLLSGGNPFFSCATSV
jgi:hypothetical protein